MGKNYTHKRNVNNLATHSKEKGYIGKKRKGMNQLTASEMTFKTQQQLYDEVAGMYAVQCAEGTRYLSTTKYSSIDKLAAFKLKNPGCYMKNNLNGMQAAFNEMPAATEPAAPGVVIIEPDSSSFSSANFERSSAKY